MERELELLRALRDGREERLAGARGVGVGFAAGLGRGRGRDSDGVGDVGEEGEDWDVGEGELAGRRSILTHTARSTGWEQR